MTDILQLAERIRVTQTTIDDILNAGQMKIEKNRIISNTPDTWFVESVYGDNECTIIFGYFPGKPGDISSGSFPHVHNSNKEYLIVIRGAVTLFINGVSTRTLNVGDVGVINPNEHHYTVPLQKDTKLIAVCVPADKAFKKAFKNV